MPIDEMRKISWGIENLGWSATHTQIMMKKLVTETRPNWSDGYDDWFFAFEIQDCHELATF
jgi:hypothetical protein